MVLETRFLDWLKCVISVVLFSLCQYLYICMYVNIYTRVSAYETTAQTGRCRSSGHWAGVDGNGTATTASWTHTGRETEHWIQWGTKQGGIGRKRRVKMKMVLLCIRNKIFFFLMPLPFYQWWREREHWSQTVHLKRCTAEGWILQSWKSFRAWDFCNVSGDLNFPLGFWKKHSKEK